MVVAPPIFISTKASIWVEIHKHKHWPLVTGVKPLKQNSSKSLINIKPPLLDVMEITLILLPSFSHDDFVSYLKAEDQDE